MNIKANVREKQYIKTFIIIITAAIILTAQARSEEPVLSSIAYGKITFGDWLEKVELDLNVKAKPETWDKDCDYVTFAIYPLVNFMVEDGIITRADVVGGIPNELGISVGTPFSEVIRRYPYVVVEQHPYDHQGHYLIFKSKDGKNAIVMEEGEGKITNIRGGLPLSI
jgi:hypothetical protein